MTARQLLVRAWTRDGENFTEARRKRIEDYLRTEGFENAQVVRVVDVNSTFQRWGANLAEIVDDLVEGLKR